MVRRNVYLLALMGSSLAGGSAAHSQTMQVAQVQRTELARPGELQIETPPNSTILQARDMQTLLQSKPVERRLTMQAVRAQPVIQLEQGTANMRPVLDNPAAPVNVAQRLRARPQLATVRADSFEVAEINEGLVVRQFLAYQLKPGTCTNPQRRQAVETQGVACFRHMSPAQRTARQTNPGNSARYVANASIRQNALTSANTAAAEQQAEIDSDIAQLRLNLADPEFRAQIGSAQADQLSRLDDQSLQAEMLGRAEVEIEEVMFVPNLEAQNLQIQARPNFGKAKRPRSGGFELARISAKRAATDARILAAGGTANQSSLPPAHRQGPDGLRTAPTRPQGMTDFAANPQLDIQQDIAIDREFYLTGFTLGRSHEWRKRVSITVKWCLLGCKRTYYVEPYAGFGYGFGLRFPVRMDGTFRYSHKNGNERAFFVPDFRPVNANTNQYARTGLHSSQRFGGQELVAEAQAYAGFLYKLTGNRKGNLSLVDIGVDLTDRLPAPFRNGQFKPPAPGETTPPIVRTIEQVDLLLGRAHFGAVGAKVHPAIKLELFSDGLKFDLRDHVAKTTTSMTNSDQAYPLAVNKNHYSRFTVKNPVYNLGFQMTPGLVGRAYVDIAIWSRNFDWPVWFPQLRVKLPPNGVNFSCHQGTICGHEYKLRADHWRPKARRTNATIPTRANPPARRTNPQ